MACYTGNVRRTKEGPGALVERQEARTSSRAPSHSQSPRQSLGVVIRAGSNLWLVMPVQLSPLLAESALSRAVRSHFHSSLCRLGEGHSRFEEFLGLVSARPESRKRYLGNYELELGKRMGVAGC
ncbi:hypothetical protein BaRGS_00012601 [Batillaria attramentaria]|uniref:Uncharacterized protein n=1 Tax=Batillaria attramentaria TaxID=370345 RepID=A0ABD0LA88_9CAEN